MVPDLALSRLASRQHGLFSTEQARTVGLSSSSLERRTRSGRLEHLAPGVYRVAGAPETWHQLALTACLTEYGAASHRTAASLLGLDGFPARIVEVVTKRWSRRPNPRVRVHESLDIKDGDVTERMAIPVTTVARTIIDLGAVVPAHRVEQAFDDALRRGLTTPEEVRERFEQVARRGRRGVGILRPLLEARLGADGPSPGEFERRTGRLLVEAGLTPPEYEHEVCTPEGLFVARVDLAYPLLLIAIECDSDQWHSGRQRRQADLDRQNRLVLAGWTVLRFTWDDVVKRPELVVARVRAALQAASTLVLA